MEKQLQLNGSVLVVDDNSTNRDILQLMLERLGVDVFQAGDGEEALLKCVQYQPDVVLLDILMPGMDGSEVLSRIRQDEELKDIAVVMLTGVSDNEMLVKCLQMGADDYFEKPFSGEVLTARLQSALKRKQWLNARRMLLSEERGRNERLSFDLTTALAEYRETQRSVIFALAWLAEKRDPETGQHLIRVQNYCDVLCQWLKRHGNELHREQVTDSFISNLPSASVLHDIGKVGILDSILLKPGRLTPEEREVMQQHTILGADTLKRVAEQYPKNEYVVLGSEIARWHHEKWDGSGYPDGFSNTQIPLSARIVAVADVYDALRSKRCYKDALMHDEVVRTISDDAGKHFDPELIDAFLEVEGSFDQVYLASAEPSSNAPDSMETATVA